MSEGVDVYWSFRSPYSYLVIPDLIRLREDYHVDVRLRVVLPIAVRDPEKVFDPEEQPYIYRLCNLGVEAQRRGKGLDFAAAVSRLIMGGTDNWHQGPHLANAAASVGLDLADLDTAIIDGDHMTEIEQNQQKLEVAGHWGVPTMVIRDEPFFGQDRIDTLRRRLDQYGLKK